MKNILRAGLITVAGAFFVLAPAQAATNVSHSKYCMGATYDPICMNKSMRHMRMMMMKMTKAKIIISRTRYCEGAVADPICTKEMMTGKTGF